MTVEVLPGQEHNDLYQADVLGPLIIDWVGATVLAASGS